MDTLYDKEFRRYGLEAGVDKVIDTEDGSVLYVSYTDSICYRSKKIQGSVQIHRFGDLPAKIVGDGGCEWCYMGEPKRLNNPWLEHGNGGAQWRSEDNMKMIECIPYKERVLQCAVLTFDIMMAEGELSSTTNHFSPEERVEIKRLLCDLYFGRVMDHRLEPPPWKDVPYLNVGGVLRSIGVGYKMWTRNGTTWFPSEDGDSIL